MVETIASLLRRSAALASVSDTPRLDIEVLLGHVLQKSRTYLFTWPEHALSEDEYRLFEALFERRLRGEPVAHLTGSREFWSLSLSVSPATLIPRPDTELLVETALQLPLPESAKVIDLGTGTGAIALALACEQPAWQVVAVDAVDAAVILADTNRRQLGLLNVDIRQSDWFAALGDLRFDLVISNPPYIDSSDPHLQQGDVRFEPKSALVAEGRGLADLETIIQQAPVHLNNGGWLLLEHGWQQAQGVRELMQAAGFDRVETRQDLGGRDRATLGQWTDSA